MIDKLIYRDKKLTWDQLLKALEANPARIPWEDGLPEEFAVGLEPYRERLEATYSPATNPFELLELD